MLSIYPEILDSKRLAVFQKLGQVDKSAYLVGGTSLALQIKHRRSIDFDMAVSKPVKRNLLRKVNEVFTNYTITPVIDQPSELTFMLDNEVKVTFFYSPFPNLYPLKQHEYLNLAGIGDLASNKVQTVGRRGEWKDYVDIYFILNKVGL